MENLKVGGHARDTQRETLRNDVPGRVGNVLQRHEVNAAQYLVAVPRYVIPLLIGFVS